MSVSLKEIVLQFLYVMEFFMQVAADSQHSLKPLEHSCGIKGLDAMPFKSTNGYRIDVEPLGRGV